MRAWPIALHVLAAGCAAPAPAGIAHEAESTVAAGVPPPPAEEAECASGGRAVAIGARPVGLAGAVPPGAGEVWLRLSCVRGATAPTLRIEAGGRSVAIALPATLHRERFEWLRAGDLRLDPGERRVALRLEGAGEVLLDRWACLPPRAAPDAAWSPGVWRSADRSIEVRAACGAAVVDPDWILHVLRQQREVVGRLFGAALERPLVLIALPAGRWPRRDAGAFQNGCAIFLRDDELHLPWRSYAHEIAHLHEDERRLDLPWFLSEGIACAVALEVEARILGEPGPVVAKRAALERLLAEGDAWHRPGGAGTNVLFLCDEEPSDESQRESAYAWSTALLEGAARLGGSRFWRRMQEAIAAEPRFRRGAAAAGGGDPAERTRGRLAGAAEALRAAVLPSGGTAETRTALDRLLSRTGLVAGGAP